MDEVIRVQVGDLVVEGKFLHLEARDMEVEITPPYRGVSRGLHPMIVPWSHLPTLFYVKDGELTSRGKAVAEGLLLDLYEGCQTGIGRRA